MTHGASSVAAKLQALAEHAKAQAEHEVTVVREQHEALMLQAEHAQPVESVLSSPDAGTTGTTPPGNSP